MEKMNVYQYTEDEMRNIKDLLHQAQQSIGNCCQDRGLTCLTCDKRHANYFIDQVKKVLKGR